MLGNSLPEAPHDVVFVTAATLYLPSMLGNSLPEAPHDVVFVTVATLYLPSMLGDSLPEAPHDVVFVTVATLYQFIAGEYLARGAARYATFTTRVRSIKTCQQFPK
jgi:protein-L-isoaspartate O-methyltransferase